MKKEINIKKTILIVSIVLISTLIFVCFVSFKHGTKKYTESGLNSKTTFYENYKNIPTKSNTNFVVYNSKSIYNNEYVPAPEYSDTLNFLVRNSLQLKQKFRQYLNVENIELEDGIMSDEIFDKSFFKSNNLAILMCNCIQEFNIDIKSIVKNKNVVTINVLHEIIDTQNNNQNILFSAGPVIDRLSTKTFEPTVDKLGLMTVCSEQLIFVVLDKEIESVNFDVYKINFAKSNEREKTLLILAIVLCTMVSLLTISIIKLHNYKVACIISDITDKKRKSSIISSIILSALFTGILGLIFYALSESMYYFV